MVDTRGPMRWGRFTITDFRNAGPQQSVDRRVREKLEHRHRAARAEIGGSGSASSSAARLLEPSPVELTEAGRAGPLLPRTLVGAVDDDDLLRPRAVDQPLHLAAAYAALVNGGTR
jgi:cell division protein FtsI (penicillin-binding protein 3)